MFAAAATTTATQLNDVIGAANAKLIELDHVDLAVPPERAWAIVRHYDFGGLPFVHALFAARTLPSRLRRRLARREDGGKTLAAIDDADANQLRLCIDDLTSSESNPGFQILLERDQSEVVVGAIGKVWQFDIPFVHVACAKRFEAFREPGFVKVAWALRVTPLGVQDSRVTFELRVDATDDASLKKFRRYFRLIGPGSHFIRRAVLAQMARECGTPETALEKRTLVGDDLIANTSAQITHDVTIRATPEKIWPWLVQMGCRRAGFYSYDLLDNASTRSAREIHPELQTLSVGEIIPARPNGSPDGFEVLAIEPNKELLLGGLYDLERSCQLRFSATRPARYWRVTWAFVVEPLDQETSRLIVRARADFPQSERMHAAWMWAVHHFMEAKQLDNLAALVEGRKSPDDWRDVVDGVVGVMEMVACFATPFMREARCEWGVDAELTERELPGDNHVAQPRWQWTHGIEIDCSADDVWPWIAQMGADHAGFYSYQWLENLVGCEVKNAEVIHPEWTNIRVGDEFRLHPRMPPLRVVDVIPKRSFVVYAGPASVHAAKGPHCKWAETTWLFHLEPVSPTKCVLISRYRVACSDDLATRMQYGPLVLEPIGFAMDRRMLVGVKERAETKKSAARHRTQSADGSSSRT